MRASAISQIETGWGGGEGGGGGTPPGAAFCGVEEGRRRGMGPGIEQRIVLDVVRLVLQH